MGVISIHRDIGENAPRGLIVEIKKVSAICKADFSVFYRTMRLCFREPWGTTENHRQEEECCCHHLQAPAVHWTFKLKWPLFPKRIY